MILNEIKADLFTIDKKYYLVHCISSDFVLGRGIATEFRDRFNIVPKLHETKQYGIWPNCILIDNCFNLVTKEVCTGKPTYSTLRESLEMMKKIVILQSIKYIAMPQIGCGLDRLQWCRIRFLIEEIFKNVDIEILVCIKKEGYLNGY